MFVFGKLLFCHMIVQIIHEARYDVVTTLIQRWKQRKEDTTITQRGLDVLCLLSRNVMGRGLAESYL